MVHGDDDGAAVLAIDDAFQTYVFTEIHGTLLLGLRLIYGHRSFLRSAKKKAAGAKPAAFGTCGRYASVKLLTTGLTKVRKEKKAENSSARQGDGKDRLTHDRNSVKDA